MVSTVMYSISDYHPNKKPFTKFAGSFLDWISIHDDILELQKPTFRQPVMWPGSITIHPQRDS